MKIYNYLFENNILEEIKINIEEDVRIKYNLMMCLNHALKFIIFFYGKFLMEKNHIICFTGIILKIIIISLEQKIIGLKKEIVNINLSHKLKIIK